MTEQEGQRRVPFSELSEGEFAQVHEKGTWLNRSSMSRDENVAWDHINDPGYGKAEHVAVFRGNEFLYDTIDIDWKPAAFIVVYRENNDRIEFFLPNERRVLLKDDEGNQGGVFIRNIPQGLIKEGETPEDAAIREVKEETGLAVISIKSMGNVAQDAANSQTEMPYFLAEVKKGTKSYYQSLETSEEIRASEDDWFTLEEILQQIVEQKKRCGKSLAAILLATGFLGLWSGSEKNQSDDFEHTMHQYA